jgi:hypothetical protein
VLIGGGHELCAVDRLQRRRAPEATGRPLPDESRRRGERPAVEAFDYLHEPIFVSPLDRAFKLAHPGPLPVALVPVLDRLAEQV